MKLIDHINENDGRLAGFSVMVNGERQIIKRVLNYCVSTNDCCIELQNGRLPRVDADSRVWLVAGKDLTA